MQKFDNESIRRLFTTISKMENSDECYKFFLDLCTIKEIQDMAQRLDTAIMLDEKASYQEIANKVKVSTATISRVNRCLNYGTGGYELALKKIKEDK